MTLPATPLTVVCPNCGSGAVFYSCDPHCCFNHVCGDCRASWQHRTRPVQASPPSSPADPSEEYDTAHPSAPCAGCGQLVFQIESSGVLWCTVCRCTLELACTEVAPWAG